MAHPSNNKMLEAEKRVRAAIKGESLSLDLSGLALTQLPSSLNQLTQLQELDLSYNQLTTLPDWIGQLTQLRESLNLSGNQLTTLPDSLGQLTQLRGLWLGRNQLTMLPNSFGQLSQLQQLSLTHNQLTTLPDSLGQLTQLQQLHLSGNQLTTLPDWLGQLTQLQMLSLSHNPQNVHLYSFSQLTQVRGLDLSNNQLRMFPDSLGQLTQLQGLWLYDNQLTMLPDSLGQLAQLDGLDLDHNQLTILPDSLGQLTQLQGLSLRHNQLTVLPDSLGQLAQLRMLDLSHNRLTMLPDTLQQIQSLNSLFLHGNQALRLPRSILGPENTAVTHENRRAASPKAILDYYFGQKQAGRPLNEMKLLLVGRGGAGKTSLARALQGHPFNPHLKETKGITITPWALGAGKNQIKVHTWDFAGQIITHAAHQFFFTQQSLYILALTGRENSERTDAEYWLHLIQAFGTDRASGEMSPVIIVLNKSKSHSCHVDHNALQEKYPFIVGFVDTDCKAGTGISTLKRLVQKTAKRLPTVHSPFPSAWWAIKEELEKNDRDYLSYADFRALCARLGETDESRQDSLAIILHSLGVALNYADDLRLRDTTILNPHWVTNGIYALLRDATRNDGTGELHLKDVQRVLPKETPSMQRYMVELLRRFELAFPLTGQGDRWLVPQRLAEQQPKLATEWQRSDVTRLRYHYTTLLEGLLPRFITKTYPLSEGQPRWMNGVVLEENGCRALVRVDQAERLITVAVRGEPSERRRLLGLIRADFQKIHSDIEGLNPKEEIELAEKPGIYVDLHILQLDEQNKKSSFAATSEGTIPVNPSTELNRVSAPAARDPHQWKAKLFISYSSADDKYYDALHQRLKPFVSEGLVTTWGDRRLVVGQEWDKIIRRELKEATSLFVL